MTTNFLLTIEYDGSAYHGWQRQKTDPTIQAEIESALKTMTGGKVTVTGSGRTDAGVHALGQTANFACNTHLTPDIFVKGLNSLLPDDIVIIGCQQVPPDFHARFSAISKTYHYRIVNRLTAAAIGRQYAWHIGQKLDLEGMQAATQIIRGKHDFKSFEGAGSPRAHTVRTIRQAEIRMQKTGRIRFSIEADGFLRYMVRNIVGALVAVGRGKITPDDVQTILAARDRARAPATAPPHGLFLVKVDYGENSTAI